MSHDPPFEDGGLAIFTAERTTAGDFDGAEPRETNGQGRSLDAAPVLSVSGIPKPAPTLEVEPGYTKRNGARLQTHEHMGERLFPFPHADGVEALAKRSFRVSAGVRAAGYEEKIVPPRVLFEGGDLPADGIPFGRHEGIGGHDPPGQMKSLSQGMKQVLDPGLGDP